VLCGLYYNPKNKEQ
jgi:hypothetical protein